ncbi:hypothetical protein E4U43_003967 [Claviceps pusilla]|uniref:Asl1-like glycosyl hydrolase catalytic domain-containing protein n=1 Tax=Claviceps pusilla TaxID=123648 RepID=A0A9P7N659_9HYPO|nr:hypothetical protein E4U43_003967 [Claviceps pusilla]
MLTNHIAVLLGAAALIGDATALNIHRQEHGHGHVNKLERKQDVVVWETTVETIYVTDKTFPAPTPVDDGSDPVDYQQPAPAAAQPTPVDSQPKPAAAQPNPVAAQPAPAAAQPKPVAAQPNPVAAAAFNVKNDAVAAVAAALPTPLLQVAGGVTGGVSVGASIGTSSKGTSSKGPGFSSKRGLAYNDAALANMVGASGKNGVCGWAYNWGQYPGNLNSQYEFIPTLWGRGPHNQNNDFFNSWPSSASKAVSNGAKALFSFNEPDNKGQANMDPATAATLHTQQMNPYSGKTLIGAPSVSNSNLQGEGLDWLTAWIKQCKTKGCIWDFCNIHWYSPVDAIDTLYDHIAQAHKICEGKPIWLTEFAPVGASDAQAADFLAKVIPKLEAIDYLHAYSYFMVGSGSLQMLSSGSTLNSIGNKYVSM